MYPCSECYEPRCEWFARPDLDIFVPYEQAEQLALYLVHKEGYSRFLESTPENDWYWDEWDGENGNEETRLPIRVIRLQRLSRDEPGDARMRIDLIVPKLPIHVGIPLLGPQQLADNADTLCRLR